MEQSKLNEILRLHKLWLENHKDGVRAHLAGDNIGGANLEGAILRVANIRSANLAGANLERANLEYAHLEETILLRADLEYANLEEAILVRANLEYANLAGANLERANLMGAIGNMKNVKSMQIEKYSIAYTSSVLQINCQKHKINTWFEFSDDEIKAMDNGALEWWKKWKDVIKNIIEMSPAEHTGYKEG